MNSIKRHHIAFICGSGSSQKGKYQWIWIQIHNQCCRICILKCRSRSLQKLRSGSRSRSNLSPMHWAQNSDQFTFLKFENLSTGSKLRSQKGGHFCPKIIVTLLFWPKFTIFGQQIWAPWQKYP